MSKRRVLGYVFHNTRSNVDRGYAQNFQKSQDIATFISDLDLADGDVVVDNSSPCVPLAIVLSRNPKVFVIPNDRDFQRILADPLTFHANYILLPPPGGQGSLTAANRLYPALYGTGRDSGSHQLATLRALVWGCWSLSAISPVSRDPTSGNSIVDSCKVMWDGASSRHTRRLRTPRCVSHAVPYPDTPAKDGHDKDDPEKKGQPCDT